MTPELALAGYLPRDLLLSPGFVSRCWDAAAALAAALAGGPAVLVGLPEPNPSDEGRPLFNTAVLLRDGRVDQRFRKALLPTYDVFDEDRYFEPFRGPQVLELGNRRLGISICEDVWNDRDFWKRRRYHFDPVQELVGAGADAIVNLSASPFSIGKPHLREQMLSSMAAKHHRPVLYVNQVGGNDDLVFDGRSSAFNADGAPIARGRSFATDIVIVDLDGSTPLAPPPRARRRVGDLGRARAGHEGLRQEVRLLVRRARTVGRRRLRADGRHCRRSRRTDHVLGVLMPSPYSSQGSIDDALELARHLGIDTLTLPIEPAMKAMEHTLEDRRSVERRATSPKKTSRRASAATC